MEAVLSRVPPPEIGRGTALSLISPPPRGARFRPGEYIRFETLMGELVQCKLDPELHVLDCRDDCEHLNLNH